MTIEEVKGILRAKFQGLEGAVMDWQAGKIMRQCQTMEEAERVVEELVLQKLVEGYADYRATQASQSAVANYKREQGGAGGAKDRQSLAEVSENEQETEEAPQWAKALIEQSKALGERLTALEGARVKETRGARFEKLLEGIPDTFRRAYERVPVDDYSDTDFDALCEEVGREVSTLKTELTARGGRVGFPPVGSGTEGTKELPTQEEAEAFLQKMNITKQKE